MEIDPIELLTEQHKEDLGNKLYDKLVVAIDSADIKIRPARK